MVSPAPRTVWEDTLRSDPAALETQSPAWSDAMCTAMGFTDASRAYEMADGRQLVLPLLRRSVGPVPLSEGSNPLHCGVGGLLAPDGPRPDEIAAVLGDLRRRRVPVRTFWPQPVHAPRWAAAAPERAVVVERRAHLLDLEPGWDALWAKGFSAQRRRGVRTAERRGVKVETGVGGEEPADAAVQRVGALGERDGPDRAPQQRQHQLPAVGHLVRPADVGEPHRGAHRVAPGGRLRLQRRRIATERFLPHRTGRRTHHSGDCGHGSP